MRIKQLYSKEDNDSVNEIVDSTDENTEDKEDN